MQYRRAFTPGGTFFFTLVTYERRPIFTSAENVQTLRDAFKRVRASRPFEIDAMVVLPDHLHCIWTLPPDDADFSTRWRLIKTWFTKHCHADVRHIPNTAHRIEHLLDHMLGFCYSPAMLEQFKRLCRYYFDFNPEATAFHIYAYREMWDADMETIAKDKT